MLVVAKLWLRWKKGNLCCSVCRSLVGSTGLLLLLLLLGAGVLGARAGSRRARTCYVQILFCANPAFTQCAPCFEQIQHVELEPCLVVCTWCFAQTGLTFHKCADFTLNARAHVVG